MWKSTANILLITTAVAWPALEYTQSQALLHKSLRTDLNINTHVFAFCSLIQACTTIQF